MNTYYLKKFRRRYRVTSNGENYRLYDNKLKKFCSYSGEFHAVIVDGICKLIGIIRMIDYRETKIQRLFRQQGFK